MTFPASQKRSPMPRARDRLTRLLPGLHILLLYGITVWIHLQVSLQMEMLHMSHDEMGVLATAAWAAGEDWSGIVSQFGYYGYGSSLLYIPIFLLTKGALLRYHLVTTLNSCLMSLIPVIAYRIGRSYAGAPPWTAFFCSLAAGLYPGYLLFSKWVWNETMMCLLPWVMVLLMLRLDNEERRGHRIVCSVLLAFVLVYSYTVHGRALGLIAAVLLVIAFVLVFRRKWMIEPISFAAAFAACLAGDHFLKQYVMAHVWRVTSDSQVNNTMGSMGSHLHAYLDPEGFAGLMKIASTQISAASASTYGILALALVVTLPLIVKYALPKREGDDRRFWMLSVLTILFFAAAFCISILFLGEEGSKEETRGDYYIYTRYFSNTLGLVIFTALLICAEKGLSTVRCLITAGLYYLGTLPITLNADFINEQESSSNTTILNLLAYLGENRYNYITHFDFENLLYITTLVAGGVLVAAAGKKINLLSPLLCAVFVQSYFVTADTVILKNSEMDLSYVQPTLNALYHVEGLAEEYPDVYYYNVHQEKPWSTSAMQFVLSDFQVTEVPFEIGEDTRKAFLLDYFEENSIIVSSEDIALEQYSPHIYRLLYESINQEKEFMWVYGEEELAYILGNSEIVVIDW